jgi:hypothetical protein
VTWSKSPGQSSSSYIYKNTCDAIISIQKSVLFIYGLKIPIFRDMTPCPMVTTYHTTRVISSFHLSPAPLWQSKMSHISGLRKGAVGISDNRTSNYWIKKRQGCTWKRSWPNNMSETVVNKMNPQSEQPVPCPERISHKQRSASHSTMTL